MAYKLSSSAKLGVSVFALLVMLSCMTPSSMAKPTPKLSQVASAVTEAAIAVDEFMPCLESLKGIENCTTAILKAAFGLLLDPSCCQVVDEIVKNCLPAEFPLSQVPFPDALKSCVPILPKSQTRG